MTAADDKYRSKTYPRITVDELLQDTVPDMVKAAISFYVGSFVHDNDDLLAQAIRGWLYHNFRWEDEKDDGEVWRYECECPNYIHGPDDGTCAKCDLDDICKLSFYNSTRDQRDKFAQEHLSDKNQIEWLKVRMENWLESYASSDVDIHHSVAIFIDGWMTHESYIKDMEAQRVGKDDQEKR